MSLVRDPLHQPPELSLPSGYPSCKSGRGRFEILAIVPPADPVEPRAVEGDIEDEDEDGNVCDTECRIDCWIERRLPCNTLNNGRRPG